MTTTPIETRHLATGQVGSDATPHQIDGMEAAHGPFADTWLEFRPGTDWPEPTLPPEFAWGGSGWTLPTGPRLGQ